MNLAPMVSSLPAAGALPAPGAGPAASPIDAWTLQMQRAQCAQPLPADDVAQDESCGLPLAPPEPLPVRATHQPPAPVPAEDPLPPRAAGDPEAQRASLRVHVQHEPGAGLKVWLGIDGHAALVAHRATVAVADLRRSFAGERIAAVVCNGVPVYTRTDSPIPPSPLKDSP